MSGTLGWMEGCAFVSLRALAAVQSDSEPVGRWLWIERHR
jgi:hypothetical protein